GRQLCYALDGRELVVTNNATLLQAILTTRTQPSASTAAQVEPRAADMLEELTVIRLDQRQQAFDQVFARLDAERIKTYWQERHGPQADDAPPDKSQEFFSGNIASLLDVAARVRTVRVTRSRQPGRLREELEFIMQHD
ncbi:MAG TPA: hypothetical protein VE775_06295, partial [Pyrinomonadaceae bacterium]|nr:hypothetical protein [Pyrinomonadaceae bacterium]